MPANRAARRAHEIPHPAPKHVLPRCARRDDAEAGGCFLSLSLPRSSSRMARRSERRRGGEAGLEDAEDGLVGAGAGGSGRRGGGWGVGEGGEEV